MIFTQTKAHILNTNIITVIDTIEINDVAKKMSIKLLCISDR